MFVGLTRFVLAALDVEYLSEQPMTDMCRINTPDACESRGPFSAARTKMRQQVVPLKQPFIKYYTTHPANAIILILLCFCNIYVTSASASVLPLFSAAPRCVFTGFRSLWIVDFDSAFLRLNIALDETNVLRKLVFYRNFICYLVLFS